MVTERTIQAIPGRSPTNELTHKAALSILKNLARELKEPPASQTAITDLAEECEKTEFVYSVTEWSLKEEKATYTEAAARIIKAYELKEKSLILKNFNLKSLPSKLDLLVHLEILNLSDNDLTSVPEELYELTSLERLHLRNNKITAISVKIRQLINLQILHLGNNQLTALPKEIQALYKLEELHLTSNRLSYLPDEIENLTHLKVLDLWNNNLLTLSEKIKHLRELVTLIVYNNPCTSDKNIIEVLATYPFLLKFSDFKKSLTPEEYHMICACNGLALEFIPDEMKTIDLVRIAVRQNKDSECFAPKQCSARSPLR